mgnify:CR=1 FL=1
MNMRYTVLIVEDQQEISSIVAKYLENEGYETLCAANGLEALELFGSNRIHLTLLDIMMPGIDGFDVLREIRKTSEVPVILLTARAEEIDRLKGFDIGADDYVTKPFSILELLARVKAFLRRLPQANTAAAPAKEQNSEVVEFRGIRLDFKKFEAEKNGIALDMNAREFQLLRYFWQRRGEVVMREDLLQDIWGYTPDNMPTTRTIDNHIVRLRQKIEDDPANPTIILSVRGVGYKLDV